MIRMICNSLFTAKESRDVQSYSLSGMLRLDLSDDQREENARPIKYYSTRVVYCSLAIIAHTLRVGVEDADEEQKEETTGYFDQRRALLSSALKGPRWQTVRYLACGVALKLLGLSPIAFLQPEASRWTVDLRVHQMLFGAIWRT